MPDTQLMGNPNVPEDFDMVEHAKTMSRKMFEDLTEPEEDILPVLIWLGPYGLGVLPMVNMANAAAKEELADMMTTALAAGRAREAVQITTSWAVSTEVDSMVDGLPDGIMPSEHTSRIEIISIVYMTLESGGDKMIKADVTRFEDKPPTLGEWDTESFDVRVQGRFGDAVHNGMDIAAAMPPGIVQTIDDAWKLGKQGELMEKFHNVFVTMARMFDQARAEVDDA